MAHQWVDSTGPMGTQPICREDAKAAIFSYIEPFYNRQRIHQSLGYLSPQKFEKQNVCLD